jgi:hypothetical protein
MHRPLRQERNDQRCEKRRLNPLGGEPVDGMDKPPACHPAHEAEQKQKKRTFNVLPKPDNLIRYRQRSLAIS